MIESAKTELIHGSQRPWRIICKLVDIWLASDEQGVPILLRSVFAEKPDPAAWVALRDQIDADRQRAIADRMYHRRKEYMRDYMAKRKQQNAEQQ